MLCEAEGQKHCTGLARCSEWWLLELCLPALTWGVCAPCGWGANGPEGELGRGGIHILLHTFLSCPDYRVGSINLTTVYLFSSYFEDP